MKIFNILKQVFWNTPKESIPQLPSQIFREPDLLTKMLKVINYAKNNPRSYSCPECSNGWLMDYSDKDNPKLKPCTHLN